ncbi:MAG TPA: MFS transporter [Thermoplasmata archaeon]|nr:MFS transporter [Thermoplasmata archaeon]
MVLAPGRRALPTTALFVARVVYAFNWYNVGAVLPLLATGLHAGTEQLGIVLGAFLVGVGIFQLPAGFASLRWGARRVSMAGLLVLGSSGGVSGLAPDWPTLAAVRFVAGAGAAFFFSPALSLIASYFPEGRRGPVIGLYNGGFSIGGAAGLFLGALVGDQFGWSAALALGGAAMLAATAGCWFTLPREDPTEPRPDARRIWGAARSVLGSRSVWALSLALTGFWGALYIVAQYFVAFGVTTHPGWSVPLAASLAALVVVLSFPGGPLGGWIGERRADRRLTLGAFGAVAGVLVIAIPFLTLPELTLDLAGLGMVDGVVFAILYLIPTYLPETRGEGLALGVAVVNSIQVVLGSGFAVVFGFLVARLGYSPSWIVAGAVTIVLLPLVAFVRPNRGHASWWGDSPAGGADGGRANR